MRLTESELRTWGRRLGETVAAPVVIALEGPLGAGKSVLARAIGEGAGVSEPMPSPTFTLLQRYLARGEHEVVHLDLYRLSSPDELWELGWMQIPAENEIVLVEWPERAGEHLPSNHWRIRLGLLPGQPHLRQVDIARVGDPAPIAPVVSLTTGR
ncbi:MAG: tRNA (adenosine(37)-N6)-threonylcarbamoyltransferase complex ATPase subunit type 1 TsaE [Gemmatimonadales bacterium]